MFDWLYCDYPLPDEVPDWIKEKGIQFQTKSLDNLMDVYTVTEDGRLLRQEREIEHVEDEEAPFGFRTRVLREWKERIAYHGDITFYVNNVRSIGRGKATIHEGTGPYPYSIDITVRFTEGEVTDLWINKAGTFSEGVEITKEGRPWKDKRGGNGNEIEKG